MLILLWMWAKNQNKVIAANINKIKIQNEETSRPTGASDLPNGETHF